MPNKKNVVYKLFKDKENLLIFCIVFGIVVLSIGVYLVGYHIPFGSTILTMGSGIFYISVIFFVFLLI